jgi:aminopeptidase-like protein
MLSYDQKLPTDHIKLLYPINRSITGRGIRDSLQYFCDNFIPFEIISFASGLKVFDWIIPKVWNIEGAFIEDMQTKIRYADFSKSNLHVVGYSQPIDCILSLSALSEHIYTIPERPNAIPYITSYYAENWGFCMSDNAFKSMPDSTYRVYIDSSSEIGTLDLAHAVIRGELDDEFLVTSYLCHPSMVNNELSGPVVLGYIISYLQRQQPTLKFTYRFLLSPETIGSIAYLSRFGETLMQNLKIGYVLTCVGDNRAYSYINTPSANTLADIAIKAALIGLPNVKQYSFLHRGSDERQFCSPRINLPVCTFCRSKFGEYPEYHTSDDDLSIVSNSSIYESVAVIISIIDAVELCLYPLVSTTCEPHLGPRGLYPNISTATSHKIANLRSNILAYSDGKRDIFSICVILDAPLVPVLDELKVLISHNLIIPLWRPIS